MEIFLIQHAEAKTEEEDPTRPLSDIGVSNIKRVSFYAKKMGVKCDYIYHSGKLRAQQTAEILGKNLSIKDRVKAKSGLNPGDNIKPIKKWLEVLDRKGTASLAIVGHLPFLDKLASLLVAGVEESHVIVFQNSGIVKLVPKRSGIGYSIQWIITPEYPQF